LLAVFTDLIDRADIRMVERGCGAGLAAEAVQSLRVLSNAVGKEFQSDETTKVSVLGFVTTPIPPPPSFSTTR
jgi:hypothetical protein